MKDSNVCFHSPSLLLSSELVGLQVILVSITVAYIAHLQGKLLWSVHRSLFLLLFLFHSNLTYGARLPNDSVIFSKVLQSQRSYAADSFLP